MTTKVPTPNGYADLKIHINNQTYEKANTLIIDIYEEGNLEFARVGVLPVDLLEALKAEGIIEDYTLPFEFPTEFGSVISYEDREKTYSYFLGADGRWVPAQGFKDRNTYTVGNFQEWNLHRSGPIKWTVLRNGL